MKQIVYLAFVMLFGLASAAYRYSSPGLAPLQSNRQNLAQVQSNSGIYSVVPSSPVAQFNIQGGSSVQVQQQQQQQFQQQPSYVAPQPLQNYLPPQQQQQQLFSQPIQQNPVIQPVPQQQNLIVQNFEGLGQNYQSNRQQLHQHQQQQQQQVIVTKDIYIHSAPEDHEDIQLGEQIDNSVPIRKNYRIVFIKAPSHNLKFTAAALKAQAPANEEKTVIYVLSKRPDIAEVQQQLQQVQSEQKAHKPEVYFIKYKTQEEAQRAQQEIQAQYDALGGSTHISDEGVAPIRSVIGSVGIGGGGGVALNNGFSSSGSFGSGSQQSFTQTNLEQSGSSNTFATSPSQKYLPSKTKI